MNTRYCNNTRVERKNAFRHLLYIVASLLVSLLTITIINLASPACAHADDGVDATFYLATYTGDAKQLPSTLWEMEQEVKSYSPGIKVTGAVPAGTKSHTFSSTGINLLALPSESQVQAVYSYDPSTQYIVWYVAKMEFDGWHVDGALIDYGQTIENPDEPVDPEDPKDPNEPLNPVDPENPEEPLNPENPDGPDNPEEPLNPENPTDPSGPQEPQSPSNPDIPGIPQDPVTPNDPGNHQEPVNPATPNNSGPSTSDDINPQPGSSIAATQSQNAPESNQIVDSIANTIASNSDAVANSNSGSYRQSNEPFAKKTQTSTSKDSKASQIASKAETLASTGKAPESLYNNIAVNAAHTAGAVGMAFALIAGIVFASGSAAAGLKAKSAIGKILSRIR